MSLYNILHKNVSNNVYSLLFAGLKTKHFAITATPEMKNPGSVFNHLQKVAPKFALSLTQHLEDQQILILTTYVQSIDVIKWLKSE